MQQDNNFQNNQNYQGNPYYANYNYDPNNPYYQYDPNYPVYQNVQVINAPEKKPRSVKALNIISTILTILSVITAPFLFFMIFLVLHKCLYKYLHLYFTLCNSGTCTSQM